MDPANVVEKLDPIVQTRGSIAEKNFVGSVQAKGAVGFFLARVASAGGDPVVDHGGFSQRMGTGDGDAHGTRVRGQTPMAKAPWQSRSRGLMVLPGEQGVRPRGRRVVLRVP